MNPSTLRTVLVSVGAVALLVSGLQASDRITLDQRIAAQRAVEEVYWRHRIWPVENRSPKPPLSEVGPDAAIRAKVIDNLRKEAALEKFWGRSITPGQVQAEIDRMVAGTRSPRVLAELVAGLGRNPLMVAETLARPALVDRLGRSWYAHDGRLHDRVRQRAEQAL